MESSQKIDAYQGMQQVEMGFCKVKIVVSGICAFYPQGVIFVILNGNGRIDR